MFTERFKEIFKDISKYLTENKVTCYEFRELAKIIQQNYSCQLFEIEKKLNYEYVLRYDFESKKDSN